MLDESTNAQFTPDVIDELNAQHKQQLVGQVNDRFMNATTKYIRTLMSKSEAVRRQFEPTFYEALEFGRAQPFEEGKDNSGIYGLERIYEDRAVLTPYFGCASYCRYCFKKTRTLGGTAKLMTDDNLKAAIDYIRNDPAPRRFVWKETFTMTAGRRARWACGQAAFEPVHMSTGRSSSGGSR